MPALSRIGDAFSTGHPCTGVSSIAGGSSKVTCNGIGVARLGDPGQVHTILVGDDCVPHGTSISSGSAKVTADGIPVATIGDSIDAGAIIAGSGQVDVAI